MRHTATAIVFALGLTFAAHAQGTGSAITAIWANDGADKVTQDELRASNGIDVSNSLWNGTAVTMFGAKNEVVNFNLILEAPASTATGVSVTVSNLTGPGGSQIRYAPRSAGDLFNWTTTEIEVFYVRYLQVLGLSSFGGSLAVFQEPTFPARAQCPPPEPAGCAWTDRAVANKFYPEIAVPIELVPGFTVSAGNNQSIWVDVYIPKTTAAGQSFLSMRRIEARRKKASAFRLRFSQSLASLRQRLSQAMVRSTIQRLGKTTNPLTRSERLTISMSRCGRNFASAFANCGP